MGGALVWAQDAMYFLQWPRQPHDKDLPGPLTCQAVVVKTWMTLLISDNALHGEGMGVDGLQTVVSLINHLASKSFPNMTARTLFT